MTDLAHYDLAAAEAQMREIVAQGAIALDQMLTRGDVTPEIASAVRAQAEFDEARIHFNLAMMRIVNGGGRRQLALAAAGSAIGRLWADLLKSSASASERAIVNAAVKQPMTEAIGDKAADKTFSATMQPMAGGTA